jgi:OmcA/MtrC family decaheme c-type cytochrome
VWGTPTTTVLNAADFKITDTQRLYLRISNPNSAVYAKGAAGTVDFKIPAPSATATALDSQRVMVTIQACWKCHSTTLLQAGHGGGYVDTKGCVVCHSPLYAANGTTQKAGFMGGALDGTNYVFTSWIHHIHSAKGDFAEVTYPQDIKNCVVCHTNSGLNLGTGNMIDNWKSHPTRVACGACHDTIDFATGASFIGLDGVSKTHIVQTTDSGCSVCHSATGAATNLDVVTVHNTTPTGTSMNVPEYVVSLSTPTPANGTYFVSGETFTVTATLTTYGTGSAVPSTVYTSAKDTAGTTNGKLYSASLYVYGPRAKAMPLLGTQALSLFTGGTDANVKTDATGFKYKVTIPAGTTAGTYGVRVRFGDYGRVNDTNYKIESTAFKTIQIGTATAEKKIDGDMCVNCHGNGTAPFHDARHAVVFNTDECASCHDNSGGHADPIANRVHAVHGATASGDLLGIDWSDVTYPQGAMGQSSAGISTGAKICVGCHTSGNTAYKSNAVGQACYGCHGDNALVVDHMTQFGGPVPAQ